MNTPTFFNELGQLYARQAELERQTRIDAARSLYHCPECGSDDGMVAYHPENIELLIRYPSRYKQPQFYRWPGDLVTLFATCEQCNRTRIVPPGYIATSLKMLQRQPQLVI